MSDSKRFSDWEEVDCNDCTHYWDDSCDGVKKGSQKLCTAFVAVKRVDIPLQINALRTHLKWVYSGLIIESVLILLLMMLILG